MSLSFYYVNVPVLEMCREPRTKSEVISQALFAEPVELASGSCSEGEWVNITTLIDGYSGWVRHSGLCKRTQPYLQSPSELLIKTGRLASHLYEEKDTIFGPAITLPYGICLELDEESYCDLKSEKRWLKVHLPDKRELYIQRGDVDIGPERYLNWKEVCDLSLFFKGLPYTWGGRSSFGFDCSGFVQLLYRHTGVYIPRDAYQQCGWKGLSEVSLDAMNPGDLIFFGFSPDSIKHVGFWLGENKFIHTSAVTENAPYVRVSSIEDSAWNGSGYYSYLTGRSLL